MRVQPMYDRTDGILATALASRDDGMEIGRSREGRAVRAFRLGTGRHRVSLLAGCHADEPVGPRLLRHVAAYLAGLPPDDHLLADYQWWIVPHINPDGEAQNRAWYRDDEVVYDLAAHLGNVAREAPGDDIEFGFPNDDDDNDARPEPRAVFEWWRSDARSFAVHVSMHGMGFSAGPWFLIDRSWKDRCALLQQRCAGKVAELGYTLHDVERLGEKGFVRLGRGFCTRPDSRYMREHFLALGDEETASRFRPSSMETARRLGGDTLTLVTEMPLFITPGVGEELGPPDPVAAEWKDRIEGWRAQVHDADGIAAVAAEASASGIQPMPVRDQMVLQWTLVAAGLEQVGRNLWS
jgi:hypothetical protein